MGSESQRHNRAFDYDHPKPTYVRFGDWPEDERSMNHITGHKEDGVSVYDISKHGDPMDPDHDMTRGHEHDEHCEADCDLDEYNHEYGDDTAEMLRDHIADCRRGRNVRKDRRGHLVQGEHVSFGHDDEPVLRNVKSVGHWPCDVHKFVPGATVPSAGNYRDWCEHPDHDEEDE